MKITDTDIYNYSVKSAPDTLKAEGETGTRDIKHIFDRLPEFIAAKFNALVDYITENILTKEETVAAIDNKMVAMGKGDMAKTTYDKNGDGVVDNAEKLDGHEADYFATSEAVETAQLTADGAMPKSGGTFTGNAVAYSTNRTTSGMRNIEIRKTSATGTLQSTNKIIMVRK